MAQNNWKMLLKNFSHLCIGFSLKNKMSGWSFTTKNNFIIKQKFSRPLCKSGEHVNHVRVNRFKNYY